jgi:dTDP-glucose 4,6-dehydratase
VPIDEEHPLQGQSPYAASKIAADKLAESFYCSFALPVATIRPFNTFGPRQSARAVIPTIISQALTDDTIKLGLLTPIRDLTFVEDTVSAFLKVAESATSIGQVFNTGTGRGVSIGELAAMSWAGSHSIPSSRDWNALLTMCTSICTGTNRPSLIGNVSREGVSGGICKQLF